MRIYVDTSVFGGCFDDGFEESSLRLMDMLRVGKHNTVISEVSERELRDAPGHVQQLLKEIPRKHLEIARLDDEAKALAELYLKKRIVHGIPKRTRSTSPSPPSPRWTCWSAGTSSTL